MSEEGVEYVVHDEPETVVAQLVDEAPRPLGREGALVRRTAAAIVNPIADNVVKSMLPQTFGEWREWALEMSKSAAVPKGYQNQPQSIMVAVQYGAELGMSPMSSLQNIAVINGRPSVWGDMFLALCKAASDGGGRKLLVYFKEEFLRDEKGKIIGARCTARRRGDDSNKVADFTLDDARTAGLLSKEGPWQTYPSRMMQMRARAFCLRDLLPDVLRGVQVAEEVIDMEEGADGVYRQTFADGEGAAPRPSSEGGKADGIRERMRETAARRAAADGPPIVEPTPEIVQTEEKPPRNKAEAWDRLAATPGFNVALNEPEWVAARMADLLNRDIVKAGLKLLSIRDIENARLELLRRQRDGEEEVAAAAPAAPAEPPAETPAEEVVAAEVVAETDEEDDPAAHGDPNDPALALDMDVPDSPRAPGHAH